jgi:uncharacterized protein YhfF
VEGFWKSCEQQIGRPPADGFYRVRHFGRNQNTADRILELIRAGEKTVTFTSPWLYEGNRDTTPVVGGYTVVTTFAGKPGAVLRTTAVKTIPFNQVTEDDARYEGPSVRTVEAWRRVHWDFFTDALKDKNKAPTEDMPVTVERFEVVCGGAK